MERSLENSQIYGSWIARSTNQWVKEKKKITRELRKCFEMNEDIAYQNLYDAAKAMIKGKLIATNAYIKNRKDLKSII